MEAVSLCSEGVMACCKSAAATRLASQFLLVNILDALQEPWRGALWVS